MARKDTDRGMCTHFLKMAEGGTCQDTERNRASKANSPPGDGRGRDLSRHGRNQPSEAHSLSGNGRGRDLSGHGNKKTEQGALTDWRQQRDLSRHGKKPTEQGALTN